MVTRERMPIRPGEHLAEYLEEYEVTPYRVAKETVVPSAMMAVLSQLIPRCGWVNFSA